MRDSDLMQLMRTHPEEGFRQLMDQYIGLVYHVVKARLAQVGTKEDIEDCVSETFAEFYRSLPRIDLRSGTVKAYLCAIARYRSTDSYKALIDAAPQLSLEDEVSRAAWADSFSLEESLITDELRHAVAEEISALGHPDREIIVRKFLLGEPTKSIAAELHMTVSAVDTRTHRALKKLKARLEEKQ